MIVVISGTNRPGSNTLRIARTAVATLEAAGEQVDLLDLAALPAELFTPDAYATKPAAFQAYQQAIVEADGILTVVPEYNGSFPGVLKYFVDMLRFPDSLYEKPAAFVGLSAGPWGALRAVEQLEMVFQYRHAHLYGRRCFLSGIGGALDGDGRLADAELRRRLEETVRGFATFCRRLAGDP